MQGRTQRISIVRNHDCKSLKTINNNTKIRGLDFVIELTGNQFISP